MALALQHPRLVGSLVLVGTAAGKRRFGNECGAGIPERVAGALPVWRSGGPASRKVSNANRLGPPPWNATLHACASCSSAYPTSPSLASKKLTACPLKSTSRPGFTSFRNYRIRALLYAGKPNWSLLAMIDHTPLNPKRHETVARRRAGWMTAPFPRLTTRLPCRSQQRPRSPRSATRRRADRWSCSTRR